MSYCYVLPSSSFFSLFFFWSIVLVHVFDLANKYGKWWILDKLNVSYSNYDYAFVYYLPKVIKVNFRQTTIFFPLLIDSKNFVHYLSEVIMIGSISNSNLIAVHFSHWKLNHIVAKQILLCKNEIKRNSKFKLFAFLKEIQTKCCT